MTSRQELGFNIKRKKQLHFAKRSAPNEHVISESSNVYLALIKRFFPPKCYNNHHFLKFHRIVTEMINWTSICLYKLITFDLSGQTSKNLIFYLTKYVTKNENLSWISYIQNLGESIQKFIENQNTK